MAQYCKECGNKLLTMYGIVDLTPDDEPYEAAIYEESKSGLDKLERYVGGLFCEECDKITKVWEEE